MKTSEQLIAEAQEVQGRNHHSTEAWKQAHEVIKTEVMKTSGIDIDGPASWKKKPTKNTRDLAGIKKLSRRAWTGL